MHDLPGWVPFVFGLVTWLVAMFIGFGAASWRSRGWIEEKVQTLREEIRAEAQAEQEKAKADVGRMRSGLYKEIDERMEAHEKAEHAKDAEGRTVRERIGSMEAICKERHAIEGRRGRG